MQLLELLGRYVACPALSYTHKLPSVLGKNKGTVAIKSPSLVQCAVPEFVTKPPQLSLFHRTLAASSLVCLICTSRDKQRLNKNMRCGMQWFVIIIIPKAIVVMLIIPFVMLRPIPQNAIKDY